LFAETNELLHALAADIPLCNFPIEQCIIDKRFCATGYGVWTPETDAATELLQQTDGIALEGTYSAKACAAMIADIDEQVRKPDDVILFWLTYCGADFSQITNIIDYRNLPEALHILFEKVLEKSCAI
jgi:1-aminocyclopropane-1-carboxylate deaminase/D-cysteine desulfhydrase-like pyridoxal-dependent ACC family enzyme